eukprot:Hpha_TRINITY_DN11385_c0_g1::TRINITY_DN11385_c0_g1_i1::g.63082::m.63082
MWGTRVGVVLVMLCLLLLPTPTLGSGQNVTASNSTKSKVTPEQLCRDALGDYCGSVKGKGAKCFDCVQKFKCKIQPLCPKDIASCVITSFCDGNQTQAPCPTAATSPRFVFE